MALKPVEALLDTLLHHTLSGILAVNTLILLQKPTQCHSGGSWACGRTSSGMVGASAISTVRSVGDGSRLVIDDNRVSRKHKRSRT